MVGDDLVDRLVLAGKPLGLGLVAYAAVRLFMFLCTFVAARMDARQARLDAREARLEASIGDRLRHLEAGQARDATRLAACERAISILVDRVRSNDPSDPALAEVADLLRDAITVRFDTPGDMTDTLGRIR